MARERLSVGLVAWGATAAQPRPHAKSAALVSSRTRRRRVNASCARVADLLTRPERRSARCAPVATLATRPALAAPHLVKPVPLGFISQVRQRLPVLHARPAFSAAKADHRSARRARVDSTQTCFTSLNAANAAQGSISLKLEKARARIAALASSLFTLASLCATVATRECLRIKRAQVAVPPATPANTRKGVDTPSASIALSERIQDFPMPAFASRVLQVSTHPTRADRRVSPATRGSSATTTVHQHFYQSVICLDPNLCSKMGSVMPPTTSTPMHAGGTAVTVAQTPATLATMDRTGAPKHSCASTRILATTLAPLRRPTAHARLVLLGSIQTQLENHSA